MNNFNDLFNNKITIFYLKSWYVVEKKLYKLITGSLLQFKMKYFLCWIRGSQKIIIPFFQKLQRKIRILLLLNSDRNIFLVTSSPNIKRASANGVPIFLNALEMP